MKLQHSSNIAPNRAYYFSQEDELFRSLKRVAKAVKGITLFNIVEANIEDDRSIVIMYADDRERLYKLLWKELRLTHKKKNPVIALSYHDLDSSVDVRDKVFEKNWHSHAYFSIPFEINELLNSFGQLIRLQNIPMAIKEFCNSSGLIGIALHDLRSLLGGGEIMPLNRKKEKISNLLSQIKELLIINEGRKEIVDEIDQILPQVKMSNLSEAECNRLIALVRNIEKEVF